jgi:hypothetical protein
MLPDINLTFCFCFSATILVLASSTMESWSETDRLRDDVYSLHTISPDGCSIRDFTDAAGGTVDLDDENVLNRYKDLIIDLYSLPCYAAFSKGPLPLGFNYGDFAAAYDNKFRGQDEPYDWKPLLSGKMFRNLLWITLWITLGAYFCISTLAHIFSEWKPGRWAPAALSSLLAGFTVAVVAAEIRRESYQLHSKTTDRVRHGAWLRRHRWLVLYILAPLLSVPLWRTRFISSTSWSPWLRPSIPLLTFSSWKDTAQYFQASLPGVNGSIYPDQGPPLQRDAWDTWRSDQLFWPIDVVRFNTENSRKLENKLAAWGSAGRAEIIVQPVFPKHDFGSNTIDAIISRPLESLVLYLACSIINQESPWPIADRVVMTDGDCKAKIKIQNYILEGEGRNRLAHVYEEEIKRRSDY